MDAMLVDLSSHFYLLFYFGYLYFISQKDASIDTQSAEDLSKIPGKTYLQFIYQPHWNINRKYIV